MSHPPPRQPVPVCAEPSARQTSRFLLGQAVLAHAEPSARGPSRLPERQTVFPRARPSARQTRQTSRQPSRPPGRRSVFPPDEPSSPPPSHLRPGEAVLGRDEPALGQRRQLDHRCLSPTISRLTRIVPASHGQDPPLHQGTTHPPQRGPGPARLGSRRGARGRRPRRSRRPPRG